MKTHRYEQQIIWKGNRGEGTTNYQAYDRQFEWSAAGKEPLMCSSDAAFRGDASKFNPEDMLVASIASCHMLWYLHLCADHGIVVQDYCDAAEGTMIQDETGSGKFISVVLKPVVLVDDASDDKLALELHARAHAFCFISNSVNFDVHIQAQINREGAVS
jgi:organic hydroperoxide reductase OsmC/OhrA